MRISWVWKMRNDHYRVIKKASKHGLWGMKQNLSSWMEIWNAKSGGNMYSKLKLKFGVAFEVYFRHTIYCFEAREVRSPTLQIVYKSKLKWRSYDYLKTIVQIWRTILKWFWNSICEFKIQLMNSKSNSKLPQFRFHPLPLWCSPPLHRELHLGHFIHPKWVLHD